MAELLVSQKDAVHGFIGGKPGIADRISTRYGVRSILYSPPMRGFSPQNAHEDWENFLALCLDRKPPQIIWVGLGAPKQELWIQEISKRAPEVLFFGVGAAFDFLAGAQDRAPHWMQKFGLEWVHRLFQDPRRLWRRYLSTNFKFLMKVSTEILCEACIRSIE
jgi:N-acetylglucosaminyldiphosphoundecaprenol N-acetyl-beta-D-mannosaminyltransferase